ncbi:hypothetical protein U3516DRAFT_774215 [Neocallimastix sp. 'constans']
MILLNPNPSNLEIYGEYPFNEISVVSATGGTLFGVAKKANLHLIFHEFYQNRYSEPHKTVINISFGGYIIFVSAGNEYENACKEDRKEFSYGLYNGSISVGAATFNIEHNRYDGIFKFWNEKDFN